MVFDKQHLSLFVALAFLFAYANAVPATALGNERSVERLRGDLHQFIEMIINCLTNSKPHHSKFNSSQIQQFKQITNSLQDDVGLSTTEDAAGGENPETRKFGAGTEENEEASSDAPGHNSESNEEDDDEDSKGSIHFNASESGEYKDPKNSKETTESDDESGLQNSEEQQAVRREFDVQESGGGHGFTPRPFNIGGTDSGSSERMSTTAGPTTPPGDGGSDIGLRILHPESKESKEDTTTSQEGISGENSSDKSKESKEDDESGVLNAVLSLKDNVFNLSSEIGKIQENLSNALKIFEPSTEASASSGQSGRKSNTEETSISNESTKDKSEMNTEEIQVRNLIKDAPKFALVSSVHPYEALHIYGIQANGPINKIVFEGGEHHPPRPLTIRESKHLKEFIKMVLNTNKLHSPMASFPEEEDVASRSGFKDNSGKNGIKKSPWADKPVPLELV